METGPEVPYNYPEPLPEVPETEYHVPEQPEPEPPEAEAPEMKPDSTPKPMEPALPFDFTSYDYDYYEGTADHSDDGDALRHHRLTARQQHKLFKYRRRHGRHGRHRT